MAVEGIKKAELYVHKSNLEEVLGALQRTASFEVAAGFDLVKGFAADGRDGKEGQPEEDHRLQGRTDVAQEAGVPVEDHTGLRDERLSGDRHADRAHRGQHGDPGQRASRIEDQPQHDQRRLEDQADDLEDAGGGLGHPGLADAQLERRLARYAEGGGEQDQKNRRYECWVHASQCHVLSAKLSSAKCESVRVPDAGCDVPECRAL